MHARFHGGDAEPEGFRDLASRPPLDVAQYEEREHLVQRELSLAALPAAELLVGGVRHDAVEPGPECRLAAEGVDLSDRGDARGPPSNVLVSTGIVMQRVTP
jgi:hypothetical protein